MRNKRKRGERRETRLSESKIVQRFLYVTLLRIKVQITASGKWTPEEKGRRRSMKQENIERKRSRTGRWDEECEMRRQRWEGLMRQSVQGDKWMRTEEWAVRFKGLQKKPSQTKQKKDAYHISCNLSDLKTRRFDENQNGKHKLEKNERHEATIKPVTDAERWGENTSTTTSVGGAIRA